MGPIKDRLAPSFKPVPLRYFWESMGALPDNFCPLATLLARMIDLANSKFQNAFIFANSISNNFGKFLEMFVKPQIVVLALHFAVNIKFGIFVRNSFLECLFWEKSQKRIFLCM